MPFEKNCNGGSCVRVKRILSIQLKNLEKANLKTLKKTGKNSWEIMAPSM